MHFLPAARVDHATPYVLVGAPERAGAVLTLAHLPGCRVPPLLAADTTAEIALNALRSPRVRERLSTAEAVTADRCDADTLLAVWGLLHPEAALERAARIEDAARAGAFGVARTTEAAYFACWVENVAHDRAIDDPDTLFDALLPHVQEMLDDPRAHDIDWIGEYSDVIRSNAMLHSGAVEIEEHPEIDLSVLHTPLRLHDLTRFGALQHFRVLTVLAENTYTVEYRRESWVQYQSRRPRPRIDLRPLAARLNLFERHAGAWRADPVSTPTARLYFDTGAGRPAPSALAAETVIAEVVEFFQSAAGRRDLHWDAYSATEGA